MNCKLLLSATTSTLIAIAGFSQNVGIGTTIPGAKLEVMQTDGSNSKPEVTIWNQAANFTRLRLRNNTLGYWELGARIGNLSNSSNDTFKITTDLEPNFFVMRGNGQVGINTANPLFRLHIEGQSRPGIFVRSDNNVTDSGAILSIMNVITPTVPFSYSIKGEHKSTNINGIGVWGVQNGGGWGVAGFAKELGAAGYGAGVYGRMTGGDGGFGVFGENLNPNGVGGYFATAAVAGAKALKTSGGVQLTGIGEGAGKVLTSDASGNATWQSGSGGPWTVAGANAYYSNTGSVGVGVTAPTQKLHVSGGNIFVESSAGGFATGYSDNYWVTATNGGGLDLQLTNTSNGGSTKTIRHYFAHNGNVGIGMSTAPSEKLEINNGFLKVSGTNKTAFVHTATSGNLVPGVPYATQLSYANQSPSDIILITHNYNPVGAPAQYLNSPVSVWWTGTVWAIYNENFSNMLTDGAKSFNVLVIKQ